MKTSLSNSKRKQTHVTSHITRKSRRLRRKRSLCREYKKLRSLLPNDTKDNSLKQKVGVVDAAYQYIQQLQTALLDKFSNREIPPDLAAVVGNKVKSAEDIQTMALYVIQQNNLNNNIAAPEASTTDNGPKNSNNNNNIDIANNNTISNNIDIAPTLSIVSSLEQQLDHQKS